MKTYEMILILAVWVLLAYMGTGSMLLGLLIGAPIAALVIIMRTLVIMSRRH